MSFTPRALILDLFGDYLRYVDSEVRMGHLTTLFEAFDIAPATVRVTMSRLRREGWFTSRRLGRETVYTLCPHMLEVLDEGRRRIFAPASSPWDESWTMVIYQLSEADRQGRDQLRKELAWQGFGPLTTSTWLAPGDRREDVHTLTAEFPTAQIDVLRCTSDGQAHDRELASRCWDLSTLATEYEAFNEQNRHLVQIAGTLVGAGAMVERTRVITVFRHFPFKDPRLPQALRPEAWPGVEAHEIFHQVHSTLGSPARTYVAQVLGRDVPAPDQDRE
jgi:phenylacetic acid degradation operon negative regulatory protein